MLRFLFGIITVFDVAAVGAVARTSNRGTLLLSVLIYPFTSSFIKIHLLKHLHVPVRKLLLTFDKVETS